MTDDAKNSTMPENMEAATTLPPYVTPKLVILSAENTESGGIPANFEDSDFNDSLRIS